jgi:ABC-type nitrate/sulfonate/bicarbonate transport system substrate-binding protein
MARQRTKRIAHVLAIPIVAALTLSACGGDDATESSVTTGESSETEITAGERIPDIRCDANRAAGTIGFVTSFDFAAAASIVEVLVADAKGYYDDLCLDVVVEPSFSTANYPLVAANDKQFSSAGSFSEVVQFASANEAQFVVMSVDAHIPIDALMVKSEANISTIDELADTTIGVKGKLPPSIAAMLRTADLTEGENFDTVLVDGFDPVAHMALPGIVGVPGWKSNEPGRLERDGVEHVLFDPVDYDIPGSFGIIYTNAEFVNEHPTAAEDFMRATMKGLADAIADPEAAAKIAVELINGNGNPNFLSPEGEVFRWQTEARLITDATPEGTPLGSPDPDALAAEIAAHARVGLFPDGTPSIDPYVDPRLVPGLYDADGELIWPETAS